MVARACARFRARRNYCALPPELRKEVDLSDCGAHEARQTHVPVAKQPHPPPRIKLGRASSVNPLLVDPALTAEGV